MSVLEDVLDLLRTVLAYFGVPQEMVSCHRCTLFVVLMFSIDIAFSISLLILLLLSWCQGGTVSCVDSIEALSV